MQTRAILLLALAAALALAAPEKRKYPRWKKGEREGTVTIDGKEEAFVALVPSGFSTKKPNPVVLLLHGNGGKAKSFLKWIKPMAGKRPPLLISLDRRAEYIDLLWEYETAVGTIKRDDRLLPPHPSVASFKAMLREEWRESLRIVAEAHQQAAMRKARGGEETTQ